MILTCGFRTSGVMTKAREQPKVNFLRFPVCVINQCIVLGAEIVRCHWLDTWNLESWATGLNLLGVNFGKLSQTREHAPDGLS
jgi:hypothetical protein